MRVLVLTDHKTHACGESIYALLKQISQQQGCDSVWVVSRNHPENAGFFHEDGGTQPVGRMVDDTFVYSEDGSWFLNGGEQLDTHGFEAVLLRVDRPVSDALLDSLASRFAMQLVVNDPHGIQETGAKDFLLQFSEHCAPMQLCRSVDDLQAFVETRPAVVKPLRGYGGKGLIRIDRDAAWIESNQVPVSDIWSQIQQEINADGAVLAVEFLPTIHLGDKRVVVVNGKVLGAMLRLPASDQWLANLSQGGSSSFAKPNAEELAMAEAIAPVLSERGVPVFGFDTLVGNEGRRVLSEINTLNVGGFLQAEQHSGKPVISDAAKLIWSYIQDRVG
jgi:glutathione synthase